MTVLSTAVDRVLGIFRKPPPIDTLDELDNFIDREAAFNAQKCIVEYARARAGVLSIKLFKEKAFVAAVNHGRWHGYRITLGNVCEMVDAALRVEAADRRIAVIGGLIQCVDRITQRYAIPPDEPDNFWDVTRAMIARRMDMAGLRAPRPVKDIPLETVKQIFDVLPIHEMLRGHDYELVQNNLRGNLIRSYETFIARAEAPVLVEKLSRSHEPAGG